jgi:hypothetical protein
MKRRKVWVGLGTAILVTPHAPAIAKAPPPIPAHAVASAAPDSGRIVVAQGAHAKGHAVTTKTTGGEGDEGGGGAKDAGLEPALRFYRDIQLIRGHLLVGDELVKDGRWKEALPHFLHPSEEIYGKINADLKTYGVPPFATALKALAQTVKAKNKDAYAGALAAVEERLVAADRGLRTKEENWPYFAIETALETLRTAADEYEEAVKGGKIANVVEYQDSRGFVWQAERLFTGVADDLAKKDADAVGAVRAAFADLKGAWPGAMPPPKPAKDLSQVLSDISKIELQLGRFR